MPRIYAVAFDRYSQGIDCGGMFAALARAGEGEFLRPSAMSRSLCASGKNRMPTLATW